MPNVNGIDGGSFPNRLRLVRPAETANRDSGGAWSQADRVDLSTSAKRLAGQAGPGAVRMDKVLAARAAIAAGTYETPEKLTVAIDRMFEEIIG